jgi:hypothetical protein
MIIADGRFRSLTVCSCGFPRGCPATVAMAGWEGSARAPRALMVNWTSCGLFVPNARTA